MRDKYKSQIYEIYSFGAKDDCGHVEAKLDSGHKRVIIASTKKNKIRNYYSIYVLYFGVFICPCVTFESVTL